MLGFLSNPVVQMVGLILVILVLFILAILNTWKKIPNDHAAVIVGTGKPKVVTGGGTVVIPLLQRMDLITLETLSLPVSVTGVKTSLGVPINAEGYIIIKVKAEEESILTAMQMFYCTGGEEKTKAKIIEQTRQLCEGKLREIVSGMTVEEIYDDREKFSQAVLNTASTALSALGLELNSFTINDITDDDEYIVSLGKAQIAKVKADAAIAQAEANRDQEIRTAEAARAGTAARLKAEAAIAQAEKDKQLQVLQFTKEQETQKAIADAAYSIQQHVTSKDVTNAEMDANVLKEQRSKEVREAEIAVEIASEQKAIELAQKKAERKEAELQETIIKPAEAARRKAELDAEAEKVRKVKEAEAYAEAKRLDAKASSDAKRLDAEAEAERIRQAGVAQAEIFKRQGDAEAEAIRAKGLAEAEALNKKAEALAKMDEAGKLQMVMDKLPEFARAVAEPMSKIGSISIIGGSGDGSGGAADVARQTAGALKAVTDALKDTVGWDLGDVFAAQTIQAKVQRDVTMQMDGGSNVSVSLPAAESAGQDS